MAQAHGKDTDLYLGSELVNVYVRGSELTGTIDMDPNVTVYGAEDYSHMPGLGSGSLTIDGVFDTTYTGTVDDYAKTAGKVAVLCHGGAALSGLGKMLVARKSLFTHSSSVAGAVLFRLELTADAGVDSGVILHVGAETVAGEETSHDSGASSAAGGAAYLVCTAFSGTDLTVTVEDSADDAAWATLATFTQLTGVSSERVIVSGTVGRYLRAEWSTSAGFTSATFLVGFARR